MRRILSSKLAIIALVLMVVTLISGVTWAATSNPRSDSSTSNQNHRSPVQILAIPLITPQGGELQVAGAGFAPGEAVLFEIFIAEDDFPVTLQGGEANDAGAFIADATVLRGGLPEFLEPGIYTINALTINGIVATTPLIVCKPDPLKPAKCAPDE